MKNYGSFSQVLTRERERENRGMEGGREGGRERESKSATDRK
jgi:hypothetical protein